MTNNLPEPDDAPWLNLSQEEIGQLQVVIGEFENLQAAAMKYVRTVKMNQLKKSSKKLE